MKKIKYFLPIFLTCFLIIHFSFIILSVMPFNPIVNKADNTVSKYINPIFTQNWALFAPDPIDRNTSLQIKVYYKNGNESKWLDSSNTIITKMHKNYISPYNRIGRIPETITSEMLAEDPIINKIRKNYESENNSEELKKLNKTYKKQYKDNLPKLVRFASAYVKSTQIKNKNIDKLRLRIVKQESVPFSKRNSKESMPWEIVHTTDKVEFDSNVPPLV
ncbi:DUF5819 family protein [Staphylococcus haemolyticus]|uniref:DUF5819 family protein n=1 Tax=Staphylococcus haemolyticus TaxID=1283 RepID=UPI002885E7C5|nr:DUF5819 family protein [Staphylococcus haemolyticus]MDT0739105.1 DUF5819 family protein [Staphylococcus haemolyticus]